VSKRILQLVALWALVHAAVAAGTDASSACGEQYPPDFPCLGGGVVAQAPAIPLPQLKRFSLVSYPGTADDLYAKLAEALKAAGWQVDMHMGEEPDGKRYRLRMSRDGRTVSASIFNDGGRALLQVMEFEPRA
jgi:hypothetical protein